MTKTMMYNKGFERVVKLAIGIGMVLPMAMTVAADATVYRCGPEGSQQYSQLPCAGDSEPLVIKDQHMFGENEPGDDSADSTGPEQNDEYPEEANSPGNAAAFVTQLEKQRSEQLAEIDRDIARLKGKVENLPADEEIDPAGAEDVALLASLQNTRESIVSEYDAMIRAAQQRIAKP